MNSRPLFIIAFFFTLGLLAASFFHLSLKVVFPAALFLYLAGLFFFKKKISLSIFYFLFFFIGFLRFDYATLAPPFHISRFALEGVPLRLVGTVQNDPFVNRDRLSFNLRLESLKKEEGWRPLSGTLRVFASAHEIPFCGEEVMIEGTYRALRAPGNPGEFDMRSYLKGEGLSGILKVKPYQRIFPLGENRSFFFLRRLHDFRRKVLRRLYEFLNLREASLFGTLIVGDRSRLEGKLWDLFTRTGTVHLLSISGLHVGILAALLYGVFRILRIRRRKGSLFIILFLALYTYFVGASAPIVRSTLMITLALLGSLLEREVSLLNILVASYLLLLLWNPFYLFETGFQLSFLSVFFLFLTHSRLKGIFKNPPATLLQRIGRNLLETFLVSLGIWIGIWPVVAYHFSVVSPVSWVANLVVIPLLFPITGVGLLWLVAGQWIPVMSHGLLSVESLLLSFLVWVTEKFDSIPYGSFYLSVPFLFLPFYAASLLLLFLKRLKPYRGKIVLGILCALNLWVFCGVFKGPSPNVEVTFLDVGHGDAIFVQFPGGGNLLIDGGDQKEDFDAGERIVIPFLRHQNIHRLDAVLVTHADQDHLGGIPSVLEAFHPRYVFESGFPKETVTYHRYQKTLRKLGMKPVFLRRGQEIKGYQNVSLEVLHPPSPYLKGTPRDENNNGVVLKLTHGHVKILFTADIQEDALRDLRHAGVDLQLPESPRREPVVVVSVEHNRGVVADAGLPH